MTTLHKNYTLHVYTVKIFFNFELKACCNKVAYKSYSIPVIQWLQLLMHSKRHNNVNKVLNDKNSQDNIKDFNQAIVPERYY